MSQEKCLDAIKGFTLPGDRWRVVEQGGVTYISDCYNANPTSMAVALETFAAVPAKGRRIAVLGDMFELGERSAALHAQVLARAASLPLDAVLLVGDAFMAAGKDFSDLKGFKDLKDLKDFLGGFLKAGDMVLLKASHGMHLETLLDP